MAFMPNLISKLKSLKNIINIQNIKNINKNTLLVSIAVVAVIVTGVLIFVNVNHGFSFPTIFGKSANQLGKQAVDYINNNKLSSTPASLVSVSETSGLVKVRIKIGTSEFDSYVSKDGKLLFPQAFDMTPPKASTKNTNSTQNTTPASVTKTDKPMLEAFVVARCPYGIQMQRAMADAVKNISSLAQYIKVRYFGSVSNDGKTIIAMHGDAEAKENLRQICIREEQPTKYWSYVSCQMKAGDTAGCETSTGVDSAKLNSCISTPSKGVAYAKTDFALADKYNVSGSPTLILNGTEVSDSDFGGRSSDGVKSAACAGFSTKPSFCSTKLNTAEAAASFSATYASASASTNSANCAAAQ
jgi:hypothetical protein